MHASLLTSDGRIAKGCIRTYRKKGHQYEALGHIILFRG